MRPVRLLGLSLLVAALAGCVIDDEPEPAINAGPPVVQGVAPYPAPAAPVALADGTLTVRPGQTLYAVARDAKVPVRAIIAANQLQPPYRLRAGQTLTIPHVREHVVERGETLYGVARQNGVEASSLAEANHLNPPFILKSGTVLTLPAPASSSAVTVAPALAPLPAGPVVTPLPAGPVAIAPRAGSSTVTVTTLPPPTLPTAAPTPASAPTALAPPPPPSSQPPPPPAKPAALPPAAVPEGNPSPTPLQPVDQPPPAKLAPHAAAVPPPATPAPQPVVVPPPGGESGAKPDDEASATAVAALVANHAEPAAPLFLWPVRGRILSVFGTEAGGVHNDGINIAAPQGTTVSAAESGTVAYAGNELRGFGNLLLIKHADGWVTAYAHNEVLLVKKDQKIRRGQPIARVGNSGGVNPAQLHFELRRGTKAVDPLDHLPQLTGGAG
jgi:murein DD-endopeptidase MepM/ murein hydrolase activator NlpD